VRLNRVLLPTLLLALLAPPLAARPDQPSSPAPSRADERLLRDLEARFARAVAAKDRQAFLAFWAQDAAIFPPGAGPAVGPAKIWENWAPILENPDVSLTWEPSRAEMASSGDLGYTYGREESKSRRAGGEVIVRKGCYVTIWRKEKDGAWRVVLDIGSPDPPPPAGGLPKDPTP
jgi:ketosteroid isomerase-like protein